MGLIIPAFHLYAPPPMITGDVPTADKGRFELYAGLRYQESESGEPGRQIGRASCRERVLLGV